MSFVKGFSYNILADFFAVALILFSFVSISFRTALKEIYVHLKLKEFGGRVKLKELWYVRNKQ